MAGDRLPILQIQTPMTHLDMDGIEMGILSDGTPYLTARTLARITGQRSSVITRLTRDFAREREKPRGRTIARLLSAQGYRGEEVYAEIEVKGARLHVIPDAVCMAILEYYAFEADSRSRFMAQQSYRLLARQSLRRFIYNRMGYEPHTVIAQTWNHWHERIALNPVPTGYFSVLREIAELLVPAIQAGLVLDARTRPDVSVGLAWGKHWAGEDLDAVFGRREKHAHRFPATFRHVHVVEAWIYPVAALGAFRTWLTSEYLPRCFPRYLAAKARALPAAHPGRLTAGHAASVICQGA